MTFSGRFYIVESGETGTSDTDPAAVNTGDSSVSEHPAASHSAGSGNEKHSYQAHVYQNAAEGNGNDVAASDAGPAISLQTIVVEDISLVFNAPAEWAAVYGDKWQDGPLFVVYRDGYGHLRAFLAEYDPLTGILKFRSTMKGDYVVVYYPYTEQGVTVFSEEFYAMLEELGSIKTGLPGLASGN